MPKYFPPSSISISISKSVVLRYCLHLAPLPGGRMGTTVFIALQCCQCSTMQVKQQQKSSNKWTCVVCNQKQSVRKVFAQGFMAKDLRMFVQSFNMSRQHPHSQTLGTAFSQHDLVDPQASNLKPKRNDWTDYLDVDQEDEQQQQQEVIHPRLEGDGEVKIVTELPKQMFNKRTLKDSSSSSSYPCQLCSQENKHNLCRPVFSKRQKTNNAMSSDESRKCQQRSLQKSRWADDNEKDDIQPENCQMTAATRSSRWCLYMDEEDNDLQFGSGKISNDTALLCNGPMDNSVDDPIVEEEIHPDFL